METGIVNKYFLCCSLVVHADIDMRRLTFCVDKHRSTHFSTETRKLLLVIIMVKRPLTPAYSSLAEPAVVTLLE